MNTIAFRIVLGALCLLTAFAVGQGTNPMAPHEQRQAFAGTFAGDGLTLELQGDQGRYTGQLRFDERTFPLVAQAVGNTLSGTFESGGSRFEFSATLEGHTLTFTSGGATYVLTQTAGTPDQACNPLVPGSCSTGPAPSVYGEYVGTIRITFGGPTGAPVPMSKGVVVRVSQPYRDDAGSNETNPFNLDFFTTRAAAWERTIGDVGLRSMFQPIPGAAMTQAWSLTSTGDAFAGALTDDSALLGACYVMGSGYLPGLPCEAHIELGAQVSGRFTGAEVHVAISGNATSPMGLCGPFPFTADITAARR